MATMALTENYITTTKVQVSYKNQFTNGRTRRVINGVRLYFNEEPTGKILYISRPDENGNIHISNKSKPNTRRNDVVLKALHQVGNLGYSDPDPNSLTFGHHLCPFDGPCVMNPDVTCFMSDCSGFCSNLWIEELEGDILNTTEFKNKNPYKISETGYIPKPGDVITHYDSDFKHSMIYIGYINIDGEGDKPYIIDCNDLGSKGATVFLRTIDYVDDCYYWNPIGD